MQRLLTHEGQRAGRPAVRSRCTWLTHRQAGVVPCVGQRQWPLRLTPAAARSSGPAQPSPPSSPTTKGEGAGENEVDASNGQPPRPLPPPAPLSPPPPPPPPPLTKSPSDLTREMLSRHVRKAYRLQPLPDSDVREALRQEYRQSVDALGPGERLSHALRRLQYYYYLWRKDTWNDLQVFAAINLGFVMLAGLVRGALTELVTGREATETQLWSYTYQAGVLMFGNNFPGEAAPFLDQSFSLVVASLGVVGFAVSVALVEQAVLEVLDNNVRRGSAVFERDHLVLLMWGYSQRDVEMTQKVLRQACVAYAGDGGKALVVLSQREKLEMEEFFRRAIPLDERHGSTIVFRQGSPLSVTDLRSVGVAAARSIIIVADRSRSPEEADAQVLRTAILLDELGHPINSKSSTSGSGGASSNIAGRRDPASGLGRSSSDSGGGNLNGRGGGSVSPAIGASGGGIGGGGRSNRIGNGGGRGGGASTNPVVVAELKTLGAVGMLQRCCSPRIIAYPSNRQIAISLSRMVSNPIMSSIQKVIWDFDSQGQSFFQCFPQLAGKTFAEAAFYFEDASLIGILEEQARGERFRINPPGDTVLQATDTLYLCRPTVMDKEGPGYEPRDTPIFHGDPALNPTTGPWEPDLLELVTATGSLDIMTSIDSTITGSSASQGGMVDSSGTVDVPAEYLVTAPGKAQGVLLCGWGEPSFMSDLLADLDHGRMPLAPGAMLTLLNEHPEKEVQAICRRVNVRNVSLQHIRANPACYAALAARVDASQYSSALILCDMNWLDPDQEDTNGVGLHSAEDMMRLDSLILSIQINIRRILQDAGLPAINIICERLSSSGQPTRFEDQVRLPLAISLNSAAYAARLLMQVAYNPQVLFPLLTFGDEQVIVIRDAATLSLTLGERATYWQLVARAQRAGCILVGFYTIPSQASWDSKFLDIHVNPSAEEREKERVWHDGTGCTKLVLVMPKHLLAAKSLGLADSASNSADAGVDSRKQPPPSEGGSRPAADGERAAAAATAEQVAGGGNGNGNGSGGSARWPLRRTLSSVPELQGEDMEAQLKRWVVYRQQYRRAQRQQLASKE